MANNPRSGGSTDGSRRLTRRRLLQTIGVSAGALAAGGVPADSAAARSDTGCARGPFEATYEAGTVNVGQIRADQARGEGPPSLGAASPADARGVDADRQPPRQNAQESTEMAEGPLSVLREFDGVDSLETRGGVPSDSQIAVGNGKLLHVLNRDVAIYNKASGQRQAQFRLERLWEPVIPEPEGGFAFGTPFVFDPRARYDRNRDRFIVAATQYEPGLTIDGELISREDLEESVEEGDDPYAEAAVSRPPRGWFVVAVSATSNPNGEWYVYRVPPEDANGVDNIGLVDYPTLGHDKDAVYLTQNFFGAEFDVTLVRLAKDDLYAGEPVSAHHFDSLQDPVDGAPFTFTVQPAQQPFSGGNDGPFYLVNSGFFSNALTVWELTDPTGDPELSCETVEVGPYAFPPTAQQKGSTSFIDTIGSRLMNADYDDGSLWTAHAVAYDWNGDGTPVAAIRWYELDPTAGTLVQSGLYGEPGRSYFMPTIGADDGRMVLSHNVSGPDTYARMDVAGRTEDAPDGELEGSVVVQPGESGYNALPGAVERWGDYNGVSVDPSTGRFWTVSQYSPDVDIPVDDAQRDPYATRIAEVSFDDGSGSVAGNGDGGGGGN
jgi:hypothetical protein